LTGRERRRTVGPGEREEPAVFVQFIEGPVDDATALHRQLEGWQERCAAGAAGWLGTTAGVTADGTAFLAVRFGSTAAARTNSDRPEQSAWWAETEALFTGPVRFDDAEDITLLRGGGADDAGFVQVIRGRVRDAEEARKVVLAEPPPEVRPDVIGGLAALLPDDRYVMVVYFTSEAEARAAEAAEPDGDGDSSEVDVEPPRYLDLTAPWFWSP
jgi:hypothetical protein